MNTVSTAPPLTGVYLLISDIQGNYPALSKFAVASKSMRKDGIICLGDIIDRGEVYEDQRCITLARELITHSVRGNHEHVSAHGKILSAEVRYLEQLPDVLNFGNAIAFHSSLRQPGLRLRTSDALRLEAKHIQEHHLEVHFAFFGHSHHRGVHHYSHQRLTSSLDDHLTLSDDGMYLINPGGIGLWYGKPQTFARIDLPQRSLDFLTLDRASDLAQLAGIVCAFDSRWMPSLNPDSVDWFMQHREADLPAMRNAAKQQPVLARLVAVLQEFDPAHCSRARLANYALRLAGAVQRIRQELGDWFETRDPFTVVQEYCSSSPRTYGE